MVVGHDPGMPGLALELTGRATWQALDALAAKFPTAALAVITFKARDWAAIKPGAGRLVTFMTPKRLP